MPSTLDVEGHLPRARLPSRGAAELPRLGGVELQDFDTDSKSRAESSRSVQASQTEQLTHVEELSVRDEHIYLATLCWVTIACGWNDGTLGPLLPHIQSNYNLTYTAVSMLFVSGCIGCILGSCGVVYLTDRLGMGKTIVLASAFSIAAYSAMIPGPPFPVMCVAYCANGFAFSTQAAQGMTFVASIPRNASRNMGIFHASYGLGALMAPLVSTHFAQMQRWSFHFFTSLGLALINCALMLWVFKLKRQEHFLKPKDHTHAPGAVSGNKYKQILTHRLVVVMSIFILIYVGIEVTIGGWIVTFLLRRRGGGPSTGYVSSGFFGGMTAGRLLLIPVTHLIGNQRVVYLYASLVIVLQLVVWLVPSLIANAIAESFVGMFLGPIYPTSINVAASILPAWLLAGSIGFIGAFGQAGSALFPFMTGAIASKYGVQVLQPMMVALMGAQIVLWAFVAHYKVSRKE